MTLMRRAPREVYRVYDEEDFLVGADRAAIPAVSAPAGAALGEPRRAVASRSRERRLRRAAGVAMLVGAVGAAGGMTAISGLPSARGKARRGGGGMRAATGSPVSSPVSHVQIWQGGEPAIRTDRETIRASRPDRIRRRDGGGGHGRAVVSAPRHAGIQVAPASPASVARLTAAASSPGPQRQGHSEFGFER
ncbi:MAG TPA: hypothetical protein VES97_12860 [Solirubrobacteraceae bacterium]|nr:hypothetical protein [Solirubrobacteraceae bacterium]